MTAARKKHRHFRDRFELMDALILIFLLLMAVIIALPVINVLALSFATQKEAAERPLMLFPLSPTIDNYFRLFQDPRIGIGYKTTLLIVLIGVPFNMLLTTSLAYGLSRTSFPGGKVIFYLVLLTMLFNGGIVPMYLLMLQLGLTKSLFSVLLAYGVNTFYFVITRSYMMSLPDALIESAKIDGATEWRILFSVILPLSKPILATVLLFYAVDRWNEWYNAMIFLRRNDLIPLQLVLRNIVMDSSIVNSLSIAGPPERRKEKWLPARGSEASRKAIQPSRPQALGWLSIRGEMDESDNDNEGARTADQPACVRALFGAPRPVHLQRRLLGGRGFTDPQCPRHPLRYCGGHEGHPRPEHPLAGRLLCRRLPLAGRRGAEGGAHAHRQCPLGRGAGKQPFRHA